MACKLALALAAMSKAMGAWLRDVSKEVAKGLAVQELKLA